MTEGVIELKCLFRGRGLPLYLGCSIFDVVILIRTHRAEPHRTTHHAPRPPTHLDIFKEKQQHGNNVALHTIGNLRP
jgi:hypothetical protein